MREWLFSFGLPVQPSFVRWPLSAQTRRSGRSGRTAGWGENRFREASSDQDSAVRFQAGFSRRCSRKSLEFVAGKSAPRLSGLPDFRRPADKLCEAVSTTSSAAGGVGWSQPTWYYAGGGVGLMQRTQRVPSSDIPPPGTIIWTCGWWVIAEPQLWSTAVMPIWRPDAGDRRRW